MANVVIEALMGVAMAALMHHTPAGMAYVPAGVYTPLYAGDGNGAQHIPVEPFYLDVHAVTNDDFRQFLQAQPAWQRLRAPPLLVDGSYLERWPADDAYGSVDNAARPVTQVSWFAARAYCHWKGRRLPTVAEWERAAADGEGGPGRVLQWYSRPTVWPLAPVRSTVRNAQGIWDLHGLIWEWTDDYNSTVMATGTTGRFSCGAAVGANDVRDYPAFMRNAMRSSLRGNYTVLNLGFRCAADAQESAP